MSGGRRESHEHRGSIIAPFARARHDRGLVCAARQLLSSPCLSCALGDRWTRSAHVSRPCGPSTQTGGREWWNVSGRARRRNAFEVRSQRHTSAGLVRFSRHLAPRSMRIVHTRCLSASVPADAPRGLPAPAHRSTQANLTKCADRDHRSIDVHNEDVELSGRRALTLHPRSCRARADMATIDKRCSRDSRHPSDTGTPHLATRTRPARAHAKSALRAARALTARRRPVLPSLAGLAADGRTSTS